jgi:transposase
MKEPIKEQYAGLDVSLKSVSICVSDSVGNVLWRGEVVNEPSDVAQVLNRHAPSLCRAVVETGSCSIHLYRGLKALDVPVVCVCARHAKGALRCRINKSDANDAEGLVHLARTGWYREVYVKSADAHEIRAHLLARKQITKARRDFENQIRAMLRCFGLKVGQVARGRFEVRIRRLLKQVPALHLPIDQLLASRRALLASQINLEREAKRLASTDARCELLQTMPGVGPLTALAFVSAMDGAERFSKSSSVGAYLGLTPRSHQSGEVAWTGRISKTGDGIARALLYEAANSVMVRLKANLPMKAWALALANRVGGKKARVALARKMAVILHRMLVDNAPFRPALQAM